MLVVFLSLVASLIWATTNHIDKYLISKIIKNGNFKGLLIFSSFISGMLILPVFLIITNFNIQINIISLLYTIGVVITSIGAIILYYIALEKNDTSIVIAVYQTIPVLIFILGLIFLGENLSLTQIIGGFVILLSSVLIMFDFEKLKWQNDKKIALLLMLGSSLLYAFQDLFFKMATISTDFNTVNVWYNIFLLISGLILLLSRNYRNSFIDLIKDNGKKAFVLNVSNEIIYQIGSIAGHFAMTLAPIALISILSTGMQPFFVITISFLGIMLLPKTFDNEEAKKNNIQKLICIISSIIGLIIFNL